MNGEIKDGSLGIRYIELGNNVDIQIDTDSENWKQNREIYVKGSTIGIEMRGTCYKPDIFKIVVHGEFWSEGKEFTVALRNFLKKAYELSGRTEIAEVLEILNEQYFEKLFDAISTAYRIITTELSKAIDERDQKIQWWNTVNKKAIDTWYRRDIESMRNMRGSVYLEDATVRKGDKRLMEEIMKNGKLVDRFYLNNQFQTKTEILVYKYQGKTYAIERYWFNNLQGMDVEEWTLYRLYY